MGESKMSRLVYWIKKMFNRDMHCNAFCPTCEYYQACKLDN